MRVAQVKNNLISMWRRHFVIEENLMELEDTNIMPYAVLKASGHVDRFTDFMGQRRLAPGSPRRGLTASHGARAQYTM